MWSGTELSNNLKNVEIATKFCEEWLLVHHQQLDVAISQRHTTGHRTPLPTLKSTTMLHSKIHEIAHFDYIGSQSSTRSDCVYITNNRMLQQSNTTQLDTAHPFPHSNLQPCYTMESTRLCCLLRCTIIEHGRRSGIVCFRLWGVCN